MRKRVPPKNPPSGLEAHLGFWLRFVSNHVSAQFSRVMAANGVSVSEWVTLRQLFGRESSSPADLMDSLGMTKGAVSKIVTRLEGKVLVKRIPIEGDARARNIALTPAGRALVPKLAALADQNDEAFFGHLSAGQRARVMTAMKQLVRRHHLKQVPVE